MSFRCTQCGHRAHKWMGFCPVCRASEPLVEEVRSARQVAAPIPMSIREVGGGDASRMTSGISELDRVLGGGLVGGSTVLVGGEPGVGKSTLLLQAAASVTAGGGRVLMASAEESAAQVQMRAERLGIASVEVLVLAEPDTERIIAAADQARPDLLVVDSVQAVSVPEVEATAGGPAQVRESAARLIRFAKNSGVATVLVGHVTKDGSIAGPKLLEHMVDVVLYLEGDGDRGFRALRSLKNRFGPTQVVGMFEMNGFGLAEVPDPSAAFLSSWTSTVPGTVVFPAVEGRRAVLVEIQALVSPTGLQPPRRSVRGMEATRLHQMLAVLHRHGGLDLGAHEVYLNVVGGLRLDDPATDLPVALAVASSRLHRPLGPLAAWGEVGLAGEVRAVPFDRWRVEEAARLGVVKVLCPNPGLRLADALIAAGLG